jgi:hypothetical protein
MQASEIIERLNVNDKISVFYHKCAQDRRNPDNGKFRSFVSATITDIYNAANGVVQVKFSVFDKEKGKDQIKSFTSEAVLKSLVINDLTIVKNYSLVE